MFKQGMKLERNPNPSSLSYVLKIEHGNMVLSASYSNPQPYWSMGKDARRNIDKKVLGSDGFIRFFHLNAKGSSGTSKVLDDPCGMPKACIASHCGNGNDGDVALVDVGTGLDYFTLGYVSPSLKTDLRGCKASCVSSCHCMVMFYDKSSRNCFLFNDIGSFQSSKHKSDLVAFVKMSRNENGGEGAKGTRAFPYVVIIVGLTGMPTRLTYNDLQIATNNFFVKLGEGGFGSVYQGTLPDGTQLAVKKLELETVKRLAYLHEDSDAKIVHCDIKSKNILLDDNFLAKVSDVGLAKLMTREQSHVFTTLKGTRGYLEPEWITNYVISEKSDVYSYMLEAGKLIDILDPRLSIKGKEERIYTAIKVALWCKQEDMHLRPLMNKVVQMLEGLFPVPKPPMSSPLGFELHLSSFESIGVIGDGTVSASALSEFNGGDYLSAVRLSGPR
ncbi:hypothetical protein Goari_004461 [Gossypium aridum]|uniref:Protein kinase domain-containing protein n=1 Tax=Gossypium aridum TaxID=34290 RepID=A0A7J8Y576_GOSAI|nr:hypothetical protein [Gossypium aridum]